MKRYLLFIFVLILSSTSCQYFTLLSDKDWQNKTGNSNIPVDIYVGGYYNDSLNNTMPCYWKNGVRTDLASDVSLAPYAVNSISVDGNNVYCGGSYTPPSNPSGIACYWKNNNIIPLNNNTISSFINSISAVNGVVYSCGSNYNNIYWNAGYWINDKQYFLPELPSYPSSLNYQYYAISISVDPVTFNFYIVGHIQGGIINLPCYWNNGTECKILPTSTNNGTVTSIYFLNGKLYIAGLDVVASGNACYWDNVNSIPKILSNSSNSLPNNCNASSIFVYNGDIYTAGIDNTNSNATVWKNQQIFLQPSGLSATFFSVQVFNNDIYTCFNSSGNACYSKNSQQYTLPIPSGATNPYAASIVVKAQN